MTNYNVLSMVSAAWATIQTLSSLLVSGKIYRNVKSTVGHKSHGSCFYKKYMEAGVMTFVAHCTLAE